MLDINDKEKIKQIGWLIKVRRNGQLLDVSRGEKQPDDIYVGKVIVKGKVDDARIKIYRGGSTFEINSLDMLANDIIEYKYKKWELKEENGICVKCSDEEIKAYLIDIVIKPHLIEKYKRKEKALLDPEGNLEDYELELNTIENLTIKDILNYKIN